MKHAHDLPFRADKTGLFQAAKELIILECFCRLKFISCYRKTKKLCQQNLNRSKIIILDKFKANQKKRGNVPPLTLAEFKVVAELMFMYNM